MKTFINIIMVLFTTIALWSCTNGKSGENLLIVPDSIDSEPICTDSSTYVPVSGGRFHGEIKDVSIEGNYCFVLDNNNYITCISLAHGDVICQKKSVGHAKGELISPVCMTIDNHLLYVYDRGKQAVCVFDYQLNFVKEIDFDYDLDEIMKCEQGFLCYSEYTQEAFLVDEEATLISTKKLSDLRIDITMKNKIFKKDNRHRIYCKGEYSDTIYVLEKSEFKPLYTVVFNDKNNVKKLESASDLWSHDVKFTLDYFLLQDGVVISIVDSKIVKFMLFDKKGVHSLHSGEIPFIPKWQCGNVLIDLESSEVLRGIVDLQPSKKDDDQFYLMKYEID